MKVICKSERWDIVRSEFEEYTDRTVRIVESMKGEYKVNWAALGACNFNDTDKFIERLMAGNILASMMNRSHICFEWSSKFDPDLETEEQEKSAREWVRNKLEEHHIWDVLEWMALYKRIEN